jgi:hypothetical protein
MPADRDEPGAEACTWCERLQRQTPNPPPTLHPSAEGLKRLTQSIGEIILEEDRIRRSGRAGHRAWRRQLRRASGRARQAGVGS